MRKSIFLLFFLAQFCWAQNEKKIDSVFQHYFKIVEIELGMDNLSKYPNLSEEVDLGNGEKGFINQYYPDAISFFEKISKIKVPKIKKGINVVPIADERTLVKWKSWYKDNKERITWCEKKSKPKISFLNRIFK